MEHIVFLTGRLAQPALQRVLVGLTDVAGGTVAPFTWEVREIGLQVAALMTTDMVKRRVAAATSRRSARTTACRCSAGLRS